MHAAAGGFVGAAAADVQVRVASDREGLEPGLAWALTVGTEQRAVAGGSSAVAPESHGAVVPDAQSGVADDGGAAGESHEAAGAAGSGADAAGEFAGGAADRATGAVGLQGSEAAAYNQQIHSDVTCRLGKDGWS